MLKRISATQICQNLGQIMNEVAAFGNDYIIERSGTPLAVLIPIEKYRRISSGKEIFYEEVTVFQEAAAEVGEEGLDEIIEEAVKSAKDTERRQMQNGQLL